MNFLNALAGAGNQMVQGPQDRARAILAKYQGQDAIDQNAASGIFGNSFLDAMSMQPPTGAPRPPMPMMRNPGVSTIPSPNPTMPGAAGGVRPSPIAPAPSAAAAPQAPAANTNSAPTGGLTWQSIATAIKKQNPNASGQVIAKVVEQYMPLMNQQAQQEAKQQLMAFREESLKQREAYQDTMSRIANDREGRLTEDSRNMRDTRNRRETRLTNSVDTKLTAAERKAEIDEAKSEFTQASAAYRSAIAAGDKKKAAAAQQDVAAAQSRYRNALNGKRAVGPDDITSGGAGSVYKSVDDVKAAYQKGTLTRDQASKVLLDNGWAN